VHWIVSKGVLRISRHFDEVTRFDVQPFQPAIPFAQHLKASGQMKEYFRIGVRMKRHDVAAGMVPFITQKPAFESFGEVRNSTVGPKT